MDAMELQDVRRYLSQELISSQQQFTVYLSMPGDACLMEVSGLQPYCRGIVRKTRVPIRWLMFK